MPGNLWSPPGDWQPYNPPMINFREWNSTNYPLFSSLLKGARMKLAGGIASQGNILIFAIGSKKTKRFPCLTNPHSTPGR